MAEIQKSALLLDYESLDRSLTGGEGNGSTRLADRAGAWLAAIEAGRLIGPDGTRRRLVTKRCYAGPSVRGKQRDALAAAGFEVIDVPGTDAGARSAADLYIAMDTIDALGRPNGPDEFIFLTSGSELAPLLTRLKASKRQAVVFDDATLQPRDRALADAVLEKKIFAAFVASDESTAAEHAPSNGASFRAEIEAFARRVHAATNIPLFSPKTYAELFKHLTDEIRENGYHFQTTAKNVADRMTETGRNVTRRQVVFIVKGLALKGHVFSTNDSPDGLAEVFREQARYLITNAGITIDPAQERLLNAWFVSSAAPPATRTEAPAKVDVPVAPVPAKSAKVAPAPEPEPEPDLDDELSEEEDEILTAVEEPAPPPPPQPKPQRPTATAKPQPQAAKAPAVKPVELPKSAAKPVLPPQPPKAPPLPLAREEAKAVIAARIAASAKLKPGAKPNNNAKGGAAHRPAAPPATTRPNKLLAADAAADALESSILAAIAEAVDVLVEDSGSTPAPPPPAQPARPAPAAHPPRNRPAPPAKAQAAPQPAPAIAEAEDDQDSGDIGDQIQRIIASYNRNRDDA